MENKPLKVIVDRTKWLRGEGDIHSKLLTIDNKMCCLGFAAISAGISRDMITGRTSPAVVAKFFSKEFPLKMLVYDTPIPSNNPICKALMCANDNENILDEEREKEIIKLGKEVGIEFEFIN